MKHEVDQKILPKFKPILETWRYPADFNDEHPWCCTIYFIDSDNEYHYIGSNYHYYTKEDAFQSGLDSLSSWANDVKDFVEKNKI